MTPYVTLVVSLKPRHITQRTDLESLYSHLE